MRTTEEKIAAQIAEDEAEVMRDAAAYVGRVRRRVGSSQVAFAKRIGVPVDTPRATGSARIDNAGLVQDRDARTDGWGKLTLMEA